MESSASASIARSSHSRVWRRFSEALDGASAKIAAINLLSFVAIAVFSGSWRTTLVLGGYSLATHAHTKMVAACTRPGSRAFSYYAWLFGHVAVFLLLQHHGMIGILNGDNAATSATRPYFIGFAFYILQALTISGAVYRRVIEPLDLQRHILVLSFCGAFLAGPLFNHEELESFKDLNVRMPTPSVLYQTWHFFVGALLFKLVFANWLAQWVDVKEVTSPLAIARSVGAFELQVYFDFAGYSLISYFACRSFGLPMYFNFRHPFAARDIPEFWRRWHVGLGTWFRENVFLPIKAGIGGKWAGKTLIPLVVFLSSAAWHGPTRNFLAWGLFHGLVFVFSVNVLSRISHLRIGRFCSRLYLLIAIFYGRLLFMDGDFARLVAKFKALGRFRRMAIELWALLPQTPEAVWAVLSTSWDDVTVAALIMLALFYELFFVRHRDTEPYRYFRSGIVTALIFVFVLLFIQPMTRAGFVYGR